MRTIVVGGGIAGLSAAIQLAVDGAEVLLVESREILGGRVRLRESTDWILDPGLHLLKRRGALYQLLRKLRAPRVLGEKWNQSDFFVIDGEKSQGLSDLCEMRMMSETKIARELVIPHGGWSSIIGRLISAANTLGVKFRTGSMVNEIKLIEKKVNSVHVDDDWIECDAVILAIPPIDAARLLGEANLSVAELNNCTPHYVAALDVAIEGKVMRPYSGLYSLEKGIIAIDVSSNSRIPDKRSPDECSIIHAVNIRRDGEDGLEEIKNFLDSRCSGWRKLSTLRRSTNSLLLHSCEIEQRIDALQYIDYGIALAGDYALTDFSLSDAAVASGRAAAKAINPN